MKWRFDGPDGLWLGWDGRLVGHPVAVEWAAELAGQWLPMTPTGPGYEITWPPDEVAAYLVAEAVLRPAEVTGDRPALPLPEIDPDVDY